MAEELPTEFAEVIRRMKHEWTTSVGTSPYLEALERRAIELTTGGAVDSRLSETAPADVEAVVHEALRGLRTKVRRSADQQ